MTLLTMIVVIWCCVFNISRLRHVRHTFSAILLVASGPD